MMAWTMYFNTTSHTYIGCERRMVSGNNPGMCCLVVSIWRETTTQYSLKGRKEQQQARTTAVKATIKDQKVQSGHGWGCSLQTENENEGK
jgi:hypothetical protein